MNVDYQSLEIAPWLPDPDDISVIQPKLGRGGTMGSRPKRVFIVEDEAMITMVLKDTLRQLGYEVCGNAARGEYALRQIPGAQPDVILMDIDLPGGMSGIEVARRLHDQGDFPVIFVTAYSDNEIVDQAVSTEPFGYLVKPIEPRTLRAHIEMALFKSTAEHRIRETSRLLAQRAEELEDMNRRLQDALANVKQLSGLLPICMGCKKIRDEQDYWQNVETYISSHTDVLFSHGFCPTCLAEYRGKYHDQLQ